MEFKFLIIGPQNRDLSKIIQTIQDKNDNFVCCKRFVNNIEYKDKESIDELYYLDNNQITTAIKNNSILFVVSNNEKVSGITIDDFYNSNVIPMYISEFNSISTNLLNMYKDNILLVWLDTKHHIDSNILKQDICEVKYLEEKISTYNYKYVYLLDENVETISDIINYYYYGDDNKKQEILSEYC